MKYAIKTILIVFMVYVAMSFMIGDYNALKWTQDQKTGMILLPIIIVGIIYCIEQEQNIYK